MPSPTLLCEPTVLAFPSLLESDPLVWEQRNFFREDARAELSSHTQTASQIISPHMCQEDCGSLARAGLVRVNVTGPASGPWSHSV